MPIQEIATYYRERPVGSTSKLRTYRDGTRILSTIFHIFREERPLLFFSLISGVSILSTGLAILAALSLASAFILDTVTHGRRSDALLHALAIERWQGDGC